MKDDNRKSFRIGSAVVGDGSPVYVIAEAGVPVLAAGGVTTGRHLAAALALGADGVWTGSLWLASRESDVDMIVKEKLLAATADDTVAQVEAACAEDDDDQER